MPTTRATTGTNKPSIITSFFNPTKVGVVFLNPHLDCFLRAILRIEVLLNEDISQILAVASNILLFVFLTF